MTDESKSPRRQNPQRQARVDTFVQNVVVDPIKQIATYLSSQAIGNGPMTRSCAPIAHESLPYKPKRRSTSLEPRKVAVVPDQPGKDELSLNVAAAGNLPRTRSHVKSIHSVSPKIINGDLSLQNHSSKLQALSERLLRSKNKESSMLLPMFSKETRRVIDVDPGLVTVFSARQKGSSDVDQDYKTLYEQSLVIIKTQDESIQSLGTLRDSTIKKNKELFVQLEEQKKENSVLLGRCEALAYENKRLQTSIVPLSSDDDIKLELKKTQANVLRLMTECDQLQRSNVTLKSAKSIEKPSPVSGDSDLTQTVSDLSQRNAELQAQLKDSNSKLEQRDQKMVKMNQQFDELSGELASFKHLLNVKENECDELQTNHAHLLKTFKSFTSKTTDSERNQAISAADIFTLQSENAKLKENAVAVTAKNFALSASNDNFRLQYDNCRSANANILNEVGQLKVQVEGMKNADKASKQMQKQLRDDLNTSRSDVARLTTELSTNRSDALSLQTALNNSRSEVTRLENERNFCCSEASYYKNQLDASRLEVTNLNKTLDAHVSTIVSTCGKLDTCKLDVTRLTNELSTSRSEVTRSQEELKASRLETERLSKELTTSQTNYTKLNEEFGRFKPKAEFLKVEYDKLLAHCKKLYPYMDIKMVQPPGPRGPHDPV